MCVCCYIGNDDEDEYPTARIIYSGNNGCRGENSDDHVFYCSLINLIGSLQVKCSVGNDLVVVGSQKNRDDDDANNNSDSIRSNES